MTLQYISTQVYLYILLCHELSILKFVLLLPLGEALSFKEGMRDN